MESGVFISIPNHPTPARNARVAVLASGRGTNFASLLDACEAGEVHASIVGLVYNRAGAGCATIATDHDVPAILVDHLDFDDRARFDRAVVTELERLDPDIVVMAGWMRIATAVLIDAFRDRIINIHPSLLPAFRGMRAVRQALDEGVALTGCTVHIVRLEVDDGPIIGQAAVRLLEDDDEETLHARIQRAEHLLYPAALEAMVARVTR